MKHLLILLRQLFTNNRGFNVLRENKKIHEDGDHYSDLGGELEIKFGAKFKRVNPGGQWLDWTPKGEIQKNKYFDTYNCTNYATENPIQIYLKKQFNIEEEYAERFAGVLSGITIGFGGSPHNAAEVVRKYGMLPEQLLPFNDSITSPQQYYSPKPMTQELKHQAHKWLDRFDFGHDWFWKLDQENIMKMLEYSPVGVGIYAWVKNSEGIYYKPAWANDNHWTTMVGYKKNEYFLIWDSYKVNGSFIKKVDWNYPFKFAKRYYFNAKGAVDKREDDKGKDIYNSVKGKRVLVVDTGEVYHVQDNYQLKYEFWATTSKWFQNVLDEGLRKKKDEGEFIGISREDFEQMKNAVILAGGKIYADESTLAKLKGLINNLEK